MVQTKLENGTRENITVSLVSDGFKIKLSDLEREGVYTITTDKDASRKEYAIALAPPRDPCDPIVITSDLVITSENLAGTPKVTINIIERTTTLTVEEPPLPREGGARGTDVSASPKHPRTGTVLENSSRENIKILLDGPSTEQIVKPGEVYPITAANCIITLANPREGEVVNPLVFSDVELASIAKVKITVKRTAKLKAEFSSPGFLKRFFGAGNDARSPLPTVGSNSRAGSTDINVVVNN